MSDQHRCELPSDIPEITFEGVDAPKVFAAPWEAQAFAMTVMMHERNLFTWNEWADALSGEIRRAQTLGDPDNGRTYYHHWLRALEKLIVSKGVASAGMLGVLRDQWDTAARETAHGEPVLLRP